MKLHSEKIFSFFVFAKEFFYWRYVYPIPSILHMKNKFISIYLEELNSYCSFAASCHSGIFV